MKAKPAEDMKILRTIHKHFNKTGYAYDLAIICGGIPPCPNDSDGTVKKKMKTLCAKPIRIVRSILGKLPTKHSKFKAPQLCFGS